MNSSSPAQEEIKKLNSIISILLEQVETLKKEIAALKNANIKTAVKTSPGTDATEVRGEKTSSGTIANGIPDKKTSSGTDATEVRDEKTSSGSIANGIPDKKTFPVPGSSRVSGTNISSVAGARGVPDSNLSSASCHSGDSDSNLSAVSCHSGDSDSNLSAVSCHGGDSNSNLSPVSCNGGDSDRNTSSCNVSIVVPDAGITNGNSYSGVIEGTTSGRIAAIVLVTPNNTGVPAPYMKPEMIQKLYSNLYDLVEKEFHVRVRRNTIGGIAGQILLIYVEGFGSREQLRSRAYMSEGGYDKQFTMLRRRKFIAKGGVRKYVLGTLGIHLINRALMGLEERSSK